MIHRYRYRISRATLFVVMIAVVVIGCGNEGPRPAYWRAKVQSIEARDPIAEVRANFAKSDFRFMAVYEDGLDVPIVQDRGDFLELLEKHDTNPVPETSDALEGESHRRYHDAAKQLCAKYNQEMLRLLESRSAPRRID